MSTRARVGTNGGAVPSVSTGMLYTRGGGNYIYDRGSSGQDYSGLSRCESSRAGSGNSRRNVTGHLLYAIVLSNASVLDYRYEGDQGRKEQGRRRGTSSFFRGTSDDNYIRSTPINGSHGGGRDGLGGSILGHCQGPGVRGFTGQFFL